jgi:phage FluMu protein Com
MQAISCSFCDELMSSADIGEHLMMCGNKTDQCENCGKYIRRAVYLYHVENRCANLDETDANINTSLDQYDGSSPLSPNLAVRNHKQGGNMHEFDMIGHVRPQRTSPQQLRPSNF